MIEIHEINTQTLSRHFWLASICFGMRELFNLPSTVQDIIIC